MSSAQREEALAWRVAHRRPWHSPPHLECGRRDYLVTATCYEHKPLIGTSIDRLSSFSETLLATLEQVAERISAWVVLPNHYHAIVFCTTVRKVLGELGRMHGRTSHDWNGEDQRRGRKVWCGAAERAIRNSGHHWASINYVHHNPVKHGYADSWSDWPWSSAPDFLNGVSREEATHIWKAYPIDRYGNGWDD